MIHIKEQTSVIIVGIFRTKKEESLDKKPKMKKGKSIPYKEIKTTRISRVE